MYRRFAAAASWSMRERPLIHGLLEADVTRARALLREHHARTGESLSFTAFVTACLARAVDEHKEVQAFRCGRRHLMIFDDVDVCTRIEREFEGERLVLPWVHRAANRKTVRQLHDEIRAAQREDVGPLVRRFGLLPAVLEKPFVWAYVAIGQWRPRMLKATMGTVGITAVGMFGRGMGWGIPAASPSALMVTVGGIGEKHVAVGGQLALREFLSVTVSVDHDLVDGAPAARFTQRLKELLENADCLDALDALATRPGRGETRKEESGSC